MSALDDAIHALNDQQRAALDVGGNCVVLAPPGSGKTRLLVTRAALDLRNKILAPRGVALITLTNAAAMEAHDRFLAISDDARANLFIGTVHSFALTRILRPFAPAAGLDHVVEASILTRARAKTLWNESLEAANIEDDALLFGTVSRLRSSMASPSEWALFKTASRARDVYLEAMNQAGAMDFMRIIEHSVAIVETHQAARAALRATFQTVYVDEYQDLAPGLDRIVRALCFGPEPELSTLFAVGDVDQAIYAWTGTDSRLLEEVARQPGVTTVELHTNYRCGSEIIAASRQLFSDARRVDAFRSGGSISVEKVAGGIGGQAAWLAETIARRIEQGDDPGENAVLCRTNAVAEEIAEVLSAANVPAWVRPVDDWENLLTIWLERASAWSAFREESRFELGILMSELNRMLPDSTAVGSVAAALLSTGATMLASDFVSRVGNLLSSSEETGAIISEDLEGMSHELSQGYLHGYSVAMLGARRMNAGAVYITTLSSSKGLEFDRIYIPECEDGRIPFFTSFGKEREMAEERNKFYVGITRARESVDLLWSGYTQTRFGPRANPISRFITDLGLA